MKRAKITLTAIAVLAIVGGAVAFKASSKYALANVYLKYKTTGYTLTLATYPGTGATIPTTSINTAVYYPTFYTKGTTYTTVPVAYPVANI